MLPHGPAAAVPGSGGRLHRRQAPVRDHAAELGVDGSRLAVRDYSAGGNLATVVAIVARDAGGHTKVGTHR